ncbi:hypothetical protein U728_2380 [Clostridium botulinum 202F]|uniref:hypothetical protein n=1 Tax=Clostridium sp. ZBS4 TaxID=2949974 RepID=UPI000540B322|nr:hypothetical protein [Clostridium sp. ZBS4]AIY80140.1 hypothetical protein U728_2380 [Clostridium botulinum 202F]KAI3344822.1 hypothetical protein CIT17_15580 [Clostridium botulinum]KON11692.1 hypothetical protein ACP50_16925 [Clostridium botulinum]MBY6988286.1 hypothetical protein [Clostridium botulinum]NFH00587.1 hypothetical protein [Clostridium botulinum]
MNISVSKYYYIYYKKKKYAICEGNLKHNKNGFRQVLPNIICCVIDDKLEQRKKQLVKHNLITGRRLKTIKM